jgi:hypothetical protein
MGHVGNINLGRVSDSVVESAFIDSVVPQEHPNKTTLKLKFKPRIHEMKTDISLHLR